MYSMEKELLKYNDTKRQYEKQKTIPMLFEEQVLKNPDKVAAVYRDEEITYDELNKKSNQLAALLREKGVKPNHIVGIMVKRSIHMLVGIMGVLKAGGCYLPIDPKFPENRIYYMLEDSKAALLITQSELNSSIQTDIDILNIDDDIYHGDGENLENVNKSTDISYVIYTSGSTGKPKGVMLTHQGVHNFICGITDKIDFNPNKVIASLTTISFDIFVLESLLPLAKGMTIVIADPMTFARDMGDKRVEMVQTTPSTMKLIISDEQNLKYLDSMTDIMLGGEPFPKTLLSELKKLVHSRIYNMYGPTETTVWSMIKELTNEDDVTIGYPIANTQICIVDDGYKPVSFGAEGEICIAGDGVALGYLYRKDLTEQRFIPDIFSEGRKMYRTGDLGKYLENGEIKFLGRIDSQVKVRGFRIELEEIENVLLKMPEIQECVISTKKNQNDEKYLIGYYIAEHEIAVTDIINFLKKTLPEYMIPGIYVKIDKIPLTPNGKVNHLALPVPEHKRPNLLTEFIEPKSDMECRIAKVWSNVLNIDKIGVLDNFFDLGGNSILVAQVYTVLNKQYENRLEIADMFSYPTIQKLCSYLQRDETKENQIILDSDFYQQSEGEFQIGHATFTIEESSASKIKTYLNGKSEDIFYTAIYMYLVSGVAMNSRLQAYCGQSIEMRRICCDFTDMDDLEEIVEVLRKSYNEKKNISSIEKLHEVAFSDSQELLLTICFDKEIKEAISESEVRVQFIIEDSICIHVYFNEGKLKQSEIVQLFNQYVDFITSLSEEI